MTNSSSLIVEVIALMSWPCCYSLGFCVNTDTQCPTCEPLVLQCSNVASQRSGHDKEREDESGGPTWFVLTVACVPLCVCVCVCDDTQAKSTTSLR